MSGAYTCETPPSAGSFDEPTPTSRPYDCVDAPDAESYACTTIGTGLTTETPVQLLTEDADELFTEDAL
jgi:hypothetical protein